MFVVTVCIPVSAFASLIKISGGIMSSIIWLNLCAIILRIKKYKPTINKKKRRYDEIPLLVITNLYSIKHLISSSLTDSYIELDYFLLIDVLREYDDMKEKNQ